MANALAAALLAACSAEPEGVGSYVASEPDAAMMVQITAIDAGRVDGTLSVVGADDRGKTTAATRPLSGTLEGKALNLSVDNSDSTSLVTGMLEGDTLRLTFFGREDSRQVTFTKSGAEKFNALVAATRRRAAEANLELESDAARDDRIKQRAKTQASIDRDADRVFEKAQELPEKVKKLDVIVAEYRATHDRIKKLKAAKRAADTSAADGAYRASQMDYEITRLTQDMESMHRSVENYAQSLRDFADDLSSVQVQMMGECEADKLLDCARLAASAKTFHAGYRAFNSAHAKEEAAFAGGGGKS